MSIYDEHHAAMEAHTIALRAVEAEMRRQTDLAARWYDAGPGVTTTKFIADVLSGQFGRQVSRRPRFSWFERMAGRLVAWYVVLRSL